MRVIYGESDVAARDPRTLVILAVLKRERAAKLAELGEAVGADSKEAWQLLKPLRESGVVIPPIEVGVRGRKYGGAQSYSLRDVPRVIRSKYRRRRNPWQRYAERTRR